MYCIFLPQSNPLPVHIDNMLHRDYDATMNSLRALAERAAEEAGNIIRSHYGRTTYTLKNDQSPVTETDTAANDKIVEILAASTIPILSEEMTGISLPYPETIWVIDPLDGTKGFIHGTDDFSVMIALLKEGRPILSVVYAPALQTRYTAEYGKGAYIEDVSGTRRLKVSSRTIPDLRIIMSVNHKQPCMEYVAEQLNVHEQINTGSVGIKAGFIAADRGDFYLTQGNLGEWDICAPELILTEAGGTVSDMDGNPIFYGSSDHRIAHGLVMSNGVCHQDFIKALRTAPL